MTARTHLTFMAALTALVVCPAASLGAQTPDIASGELLIRGGSLTVSPASQQVDPGRPTLVHTALGDLAPGAAPPGLRVEAELTGPGLAAPLPLSTAPGDDLRIPGLRVEGTYTLSGIRLVEDGRILQPAVPETAEIVVRRLVVASITTRPLTLDEIRERGIVLDGDSYTGTRYSVGYQFESGAFEIPIDILSGPNGLTLLPPRDTFDLPGVGTGDIPPVPMPAITVRPIEIPRAPGMPPPPRSIPPSRGAPSSPVSSSSPPTSPTSTSSSR